MKEIESIPVKYQSQKGSSISCNGIGISQDCILCPGWILKDYLTEIDRMNCDHIYRLNRNCFKGQIKYFCSESNYFEPISGVAIWKSSKLVKILNSLQNGIKVLHNQNLLSVILILTKEEIKDFNDIKDKISSFCTDVPNIGSEIEIVTTPFSDTLPQIFQNTISKGQISNIFKDRSIFLIDAKVPPQCQGAPVLSNSKLIGMIWISVAWVNDEWLGLTLCINLKNIMSFINLGSPSKDVRVRISDSVTLIQAGAQWGSGVEIHNNYILTCSHLFKNTNFISERPSQNDSFHQAIIIYQNQTPFPYDIAILETKRYLTYPVKMSTQITEGMSCIAIGYSLWKPNLLPNPSITTGVISSIKRLNGKAVMILTTCTVQSGMSGGGLFDATSGELIGILVSHIKNEENNAHFPHLSMAVPMEPIVESIQNFVHTKDINYLSDISDKSLKLYEIWNFLATSKL